MEDKELIEGWMLGKSRDIGREYQGKELAHDMGVSEQYVSSLRQGRRNIGKKTLLRLAKAFGVSRSEFLEGHPLDPRVSNRKIIEFEPPSGELALVDTRQVIPLVTSIPAGPWYGWVDTYPAGYADEYILRLDLKGEHIFAIRVKGDSMEPELHDGDILIIDPEIAFQASRHGRIGVVKFNDSFKIRLVHLSPDANSFILEPMNHIYQSEVIPVTGTTIYKIIDKRPILQNHLY